MKFKLPKNKKWLWLIIGIAFISICVVLLRTGYVKEIAICKSFMKDEISLKGKNSKTVLLIHGYPEPIYPDTPLYKYFSDRGYSVIAPYLFSSKFKLTEEDSKKYIEGLLGSKKPDVIVGVSLGGLIAPYVAKDYPQAKLVLIATGPYVRTEVGPLNELTEFPDNSAKVIYPAIKLVPTWLYSIIYKTVNHPKLSKDESQRLEEHIKRNWSCILDLPESEDEEIIKFLSTTDNTALLKTINNKTLIFSSDGDLMMPLSLSEKLKSLIKNSQLVVSQGQLHFGVFNEESYADLSNFLGIMR